MAPPAKGGFEGFDFSARVRIETVGFREIFDSAVRPAAGKDAARGEDLEQATRLSFEESMAGADAPRPPRALRALRGLPGRGRGGLRARALPALPGQRHGARQPRAHDLLPPLRRLRRRRGDPPQGLRRCSGEGRAIASEWLEVRIPPGVGNGSQVRLPGAGNAGRRGGPPGDFVLTVEVEEHPLFRREGDDLHCVVSVGMVEAAMGGHVEVPTPDGPVTIEVPAGTQNGQRFRLRKRGVPRPADGGRGDLWVEALVVIPAATDDRARALLRELATVLPRS